MGSYRFVGSKLFVGLVASVVVFGAGCDGRSTPTATPEGTDLQAATAAAKVDGARVVLPVAGSTFGICAEVVDFAGSAQLTYQLNSSRGKTFFKAHFNFMDVTGVGTSSGDDYALALVANLRLWESNVNSQAGVHAVLNATLTNLDTLASVGAHVTVHFSTNAAGELTAEVLKISIDCPI